MPDPGERWEAYFYPEPAANGSRTLRNLFDEREPAVLDLREKSATALRSRQLLSGQVEIPQTFDAAHLKAIHAHLFQDVYAWAGEYRTVDMAKEGHAFAARDGGIDDYLEVASVVAQEVNWAALARDRFVLHAARVFAYVNVAHPFREGNGRATKAFLHDVAKGTGYRFDFDQLTKSDWNAMARRTMPSPGELHPHPDAALDAFTAMSVPRTGNDPGPRDDVELQQIVNLVKMNFPNTKFSTAMDGMLPEAQSRTQAKDLGRGGYSR